MKVASAAGGEATELLSAVGSWPFPDGNSGGLCCPAASSVSGFILLVLNTKTSQPGVCQNAGMKKKIAVT